MPFYDYKCEKCEHTFEEMLKINQRSKPEKAPCPACGEKKCVKQIITGIAGMKMDANMAIDGNAKGAFRDVMQRVTQAPVIKGSKREQYYKTRWGL